MLQTGDLIVQGSKLFGQPLEDAAIIEIFDS
jgi:hypothetical protein